MKNRTGYALTVLVALLGIGLVACGGGSTPAPTEVARQPVPTVTATGTPVRVADAAPTATPTQAATAIPPTPTTVAAAPAPLLPTATTAPPSPTQPPPAATAAPLLPTSTPAPSTATPSPSTEAEALTVEIVDFIHKDVTIAAGTTVTWVNLDPAPHTSSAGAPGQLSGVWRSSTLSRDGEFAFTFDKVGVFPYFCEIHPFMIATVTVVESGDTAPPAATPLSPTPAPVPPTATSVPPTATPAPPTATPVPPTATSVPPTATPAPSTATPVPPTPTPAPPTATPSPSTAAKAASVDIVGFKHKDVTVNLGTTVTWVNQDPAPHTSSAGAPGQLSGVWRSPTLSREGKFSFTFDKIGVFPYFCEIHPSMIATVTVVEAGASTAGDSSAVAATPTSSEGYGDY